MEKLKKQIAFNKLLLDITQKRVDQGHKVLENQLFRLKSAQDEFDLLLPKEKKLTVSKKSKKMAKRKK
jgi:hypothetical protein